MFRSFPRLGGSKKDAYKDGDPMASSKDATAVQHEYQPPLPSHPAAPQTPGRGGPCDRSENTHHETPRQIRRPVAPSSVQTKTPQQVVNIPSFRPHSSAASLTPGQSSLSPSGPISPPKDHGRQNAGEVSPNGSSSSRQSATNSSLLSSTETRLSEHLPIGREETVQNAQRLEGGSSHRQRKVKGETAAKAAAAYMSKLDPSILNANSCSWQIPGMGWAKAEGSVQPGKEEAPQIHPSLTIPTDAAYTTRRSRGYDAADAMHSIRHEQSGFAASQPETNSTKRLVKQQIPSGRTRESAPSSPQPETLGWMAPWPGTEHPIPGAVDYRHTRQSLRSVTTASISGSGSGENVEPNYPVRKREPSHAVPKERVPIVVAGVGSSCGSDRPASDDTSRGEVEWLLSVRERLRRVKNSGAWADEELSAGGCHLPGQAAPAHADLQSCTSQSTGKPQAEPSSGSRNHAHGQRRADWSGLSAVQVPDVGNLQREETVPGLCADDGGGEDGDGNLEVPLSGIAGLQDFADAEEEGVDDEQASSPSRLPCTDSERGKLSWCGGAAGMGGEHDHDTGNDEQYGASQAILDATLALAHGRSPVPTRVCIRSE